MTELVTIQVSKHAIESCNVELLMCEARDYLESKGILTNKDKN